MHFSRWRIWIYILFSISETYFFLINYIVVLYNSTFNGGRIFLDLTESDGNLDNETMVRHFLILITSVGVMSECSLYSKVLSNAFETSKCCNTQTLSILQISSGPF